MKPYRHSITVVSLVAAFSADAAEQPTAEGKDKRAASQPVAAELRPLQGTWEGVMVGDEARGKIIVTTKGDSFHSPGHELLV